MSLSNLEVGRVLDFLSKGSHENIELLKRIADWWDKHGKNLSFFQYNDVGLAPQDTHRLNKLVKAGILEIKFKTSRGGLHYGLAVSPESVREAIKLYKQQPPQPKSELDLRRMEITAIKAWLLSVYPKSLLRGLRRLSLGPENINYKRDRDFLETELPLKLDRLLTIVKRIKKHRLEKELSNKLSVVNTIFEEAEKKISQLEKKHANLGE